MFNKAAVAVVTMLTANAAFGATVFTEAVPVTSVIPSSAGSVIIGAAPTTNPNPFNCPNAGYLLVPTDDGFKNMYASALTAMVSGGTVSFGLDNASCASGFAKIDGLIVSPAAP